MVFTDLLVTADVAVRDTLGGTVTYTPTVGVATDVVGIFDAVYVRVDLGNPGVSSQGPSVWLILDDLPSDPYTDTTATVTVDGVTYSAHEVQPDGLGGVRLLLHKVV